MCRWSQQCVFTDSNSNNDTKHNNNTWDSYFHDYNIAYLNSHGDGEPVGPMWWHGLHRPNGLYQPLYLHMYLCMVVPVPVALEGILWILLRPPAEWHMHIQPALGEGRGGQ